jgi:UDP-N-acetylglucosamine--N-acetylmuramyl-(pentapeptide) pyrophosphoryl-undecaprenol N-acetylglucosamine transferase
MRVIISGGGTGGHIFPALAIAGQLKKNDPRTEILFVGAKGKMEMEKVPAAGYAIEGLWISGLQRNAVLANLSFPFKVLSSLWRAGAILRRFRPDVAVGVGGYASGPLLYMAVRRGIPSLIQEQNSYAGITNRILGKRVQKICVAYEGMDRFFPAGKIVKTGNPVREETVRTEGKKNEALNYFGLDARMPVLLVVGGSQGARSINRAVAAGAGRLLEAGIQVIWQTGKPFFPEAKALAGSLDDDRLKPYAFIDRMDLAYAAADLVVSRAGAGTVSELCIVGKPAVLVPLPTAAEDHQTRNCRALVEKDAAVLVRDADANERLAAEAIALLRDTARREKLAANIARLALPGSAAAIAREIALLVKRRC